jgi:hypothetical protein
VGLWNEYSFADNSRVKIILKKAMINYRKYCTVWNMLISKDNNNENHYYNK